MTCTFVALWSTCVPASPLEAVTVYDEGTSGDLADFVEVAPWITPGTSVGALSPGENIVAGNYTGVTPRDSDVFTFEIPTGHTLVSIDLAYEIASGNPGGGSYVAIQSGAELGTGMSTVANNLSNGVINGSGNLLESFELGPAYGGQGLSAPLPAGQYTLGLHETGNAVINYSLTFRVSAIPEPSTLAVGLFPLIGACGYRRRSV
jgi:hypothetical protein